MKFTSLFALLVLLAAFSFSAVAGPYGPTFQVDHNTDRQGGDYKEMDVAGLGECQKLCAHDPNCKSFTYVHPKGQAPNYDNPHPRCWLKHNVPGKRKDNCCITGVKQNGGPMPGGPSYGASFTVEHGTDRQGADFHSQPVSNMAQCQQMCANDPQCRAFTFVRPHGQAPNYNNPQPICWLKNGIPGKRADKCCVTGIKN